MKRTAILVAALSLLITSSARAGLIFQTGNHPQPNEENVLFSADGLTSGPALTVTGQTQHSGFIVEFTGVEDLVTPAQGQARVAAMDGQFTFLAISLADAVFTDIIANLNTINGQAGTATISAFEVGGGMATFAFAVGNGSNFFTLLATDETRIERVEIASTVGVEDLRQPRISGPTSTVPVGEPATLLLLGCGLVSLGVARRRR